MDGGAVIEQMRWQVLGLGKGLGMRLGKGLGMRWGKSLGMRLGMELVSNHGSKNGDWGLG